MGTQRLTISRAQQITRGMAFILISAALGRMAIDGNKRTPTQEKKARPGRLQSQPAKSPTGAICGGMGCADPQQKEINSRLQRRLILSRFWRLDRPETGGFSIPLFIPLMTPKFTPKTISLVLFCRRKDDENPLIIKRFLEFAFLCFYSISRGKDNSNPSFSARERRRVSTRRLFLANF